MASRVVGGTRGEKRSHATRISLFKLGWTSSHLSDTLVILFAVSYRPFKRIYVFFSRISTSRDHRRDRPSSGRHRRSPKRDRRQNPMANLSIILGNQVPRVLFVP